MAAGFVVIPFPDANGVSRNLKYWSSDGTITGDLTPAPLMVEEDYTRSGLRALLDGLEGYTDGIEALLGTIGTNTGVAPDVNTGLVGSGTQRVTVASNDALVVAAQALQLTGTTITSTAVRESNTTTYAPNDAWSDDDTSPTAGGYTLTGMARASGGSGMITDMMIVSTNDPALLLQAELWVFDQAFTNVNDNVAYALSDADVVNLVAVIPFAMQTTVAGSSTNSYAHLTGLGIGYKCVGSANLRYIIKVKNAYIPANAETITVRAKVQFTS